MGLWNGIANGIGAKKRGISWSSYCPTQLITEADILIDEMDATTGWTPASVTLASDAVNKYSGTASLKVTNASGGGAFIYKDISCDMSKDNGSSFRIWVFPEANAATTSNYFQVFLFEDGTRTNYSYASISFAGLVAGEWNLISNIAWLAVGTPTWNIIRIRILTAPKAGQTCVTNFDLFSWGREYKNAVLLSFDDGDSSLYTKVYPLLKARHMAATAYIISSRNNTAIEPYFNEMSNGHLAFANHTSDHVDLRTLSEADTIIQFDECKTYLDGKGLTEASDCVAYPYGFYDADTLAACLNWPARIGRTAQGTGANVSAMQSFYQDLSRMFPYKVPSYEIGSPTSLQAVKNDIDATLLKSGVVISLLFHKIVDANPAPSDWTTQELSDLLDFIALRGLQTLTIDEYQQIYSADITVNHK